MKKRNIKAIASVAIILMLFSITLKVFATDDIRIEVANIEAISPGLDDIPAYGNDIIVPELIVQVGAPAYLFHPTWERKVEDEWQEWGLTDKFMSGVWRIKCTIYIDNDPFYTNPDAGDTHKLANQVTLKVNGEDWEVLPSIICENYSYAYAYSKEYLFEEPEELQFFYSELYDVPSSKVGISISSINVSKSVEGGTKPYTFTKTSGPDWINISDSGVISGTPTVVGDNSKLVVRVTDSKEAYKEITLNVDKTYVKPDDRIKISKLEASSDIDSIPFIGRKTVRPNLQILEGNPAYFYFGQWERKDEINDEWIKYGETGVFTPGTWRFTTNIYIDNDTYYNDGTPGYTHILADDFTVIVNGRKWYNEPVEHGDEYSYTQVYSDEYILEEGKIPFTDVGEATWYFDSVKYVAERGIITGYNRETFGPFNNLTREQLVNILWRIEGKPDASELENKFDDVPDESWYTDAIKWASANDIVKGHGGTSLFGVGENIIRQDLAIMLANYAKYKEKYNKPEVTLDGFADGKAVSEYAIDAVRWASKNGIISGNANSDGTRTIAPLANAMRCEAAVMLMRFCENILN